MVVSSKVERLTPVLEGLRSLLFPMQWPHVYITNLFLALADFINAPMPFLIGVLRHVFSDLDVPEDVIVFDIDIDEVRVCSQMPPPFPQQHLEFLSNALQVRNCFVETDSICLFSFKYLFRRMRMYSVWTVHLRRIPLCQVALVLVCSTLMALQPLFLKTLLL